MNWYPVNLPDRMVIASWGQEWLLWSMQQFVLTEIGIYSGFAFLSSIFLLAPPPINLQNDLFTILGSCYSMQHPFDQGTHFIAKKCRKKLCLWN